MTRASHAIEVTTFPDPTLTASLYFAGHLDEAIFRIVLPFWRKVQEQDPEGVCSLWLMRYGRGGEHLKIRVHGPAERRSDLEGLLENSARTYLSGLTELAEPVRKRGWHGAPPIDAEDAVETDHPDRTLLWTRYGRSHVSLGGKPFLDDDRYAALFTTCLARGCELVLALEPAENGTIPHRVRQSTLLKALISGLAALGFDAEKREQYLTYHRDWLLRFIMPREEKIADVDPVQKLLQRFATRIAAMGPSLAILRQSAVAEWQGAVDAQRRSSLDAAWRSALVDLLAYIAPFSGDPSYHLDPFAADPVFSPIFKVFHGLGNQLGLHLADEGFAHHTLLQATARQQDLRSAE